MALRLTTPAVARDDVPPAPSAPAVPPAQALAAQAEALLRAQDVDGYRALFARAAGIDDIHRRWQAQITLVRIGMAARGGPIATQAAVLKAVASEALKVLEPDPAQPVLLNLAGVALYELNALQAAESLFQAAARLDPTLPDVARNLDEVRRRRKAGLTSAAHLPAPIRVALKALGSRAAVVAQRARPATGLTLGLCMIVRDEEAMLPQCLAAVAEHVDEIVVVDTGSTDRTVEIAREFGAIVRHHEWTGDFSEARNVSFAAATTDWILYLDADEVLVDGDGPALRALTGRSWREAMYLVETNHTGELEDGTAVTHNALRLFRNRPEYRFEGRIHEQIAQTLPTYLRERLEVTDVRLEHFGYLGTVREEKEKSSRNIELLERQAAEGDDTAFLAYNLGSEYAGVGRNEEAHRQFAKAWAALRVDPRLRTYGFVPSLVARHVTALRVTGRVDQALEVADEVLALFPDFTDVILQQGHAHKQLGDADRAIGCFERCLELGDASSQRSSTVGCGTFLALVGLAEVHRAAGDVDAAVAALERCLREHPGYLGAVEPLASALLARGTAPADVVTTVHSLLGTLTPGARFMLAVPLYERGAVVEAEGELRALLAQRPTTHQARVALAEALLSQDRLDEAGAEAALVPADAPCADAAARTAAFAALAAGGDPDLEAARAAGLPEDELRALQAWWDGAPEGTTVPAAAMPLIAAMLEALARLERFDAFETLAAVAEALELPWRERRELLAGVYLRRGFLESAGDEWLAVCGRTGPDERALRGLAEVARRRGLDEDADVLESALAELGS